MTEEPILPTRLVAEPWAPLPTVWEAPLRFTGTGGEYFRIWVVNALLTLVTLGLYSPWAKVRKTGWFWRNTQLDGVAFQYHGQPLAILRGRLLALVLLAAYSLSGHLARATSLAILAALGALAPWLLLRARRLALASTSWRGVRFAFDATAGEAAAAALPGVLLWLGLAAAAGGSSAGDLALLLLAGLAFALAVPGLHARLERHRRGHTRWGAVRFELDRCAGAFYRAYLEAAVLLFGFACIGTGILAGGLEANGLASPAELGWPALASAYATFLLGALVAGSYLVARIQQVVWPATHGGPARFATRAAAWPLVLLVLRSALLTLLTLGLYWPYAAVALARYRVESLSLRASAPLDLLAGSSPADGDPGPAPPGGAGEREGLADRLQRRWPVALAALAALVALAVTLGLWGPPALARRVTATIPAAMERRLGDRALELLDAQLLGRSALDPDEQEAVAARLAEVAAGGAPGQAYRLVFRSARLGRAMNAFALPGGTVVVLDDLARRTGGDDRLAAALGHELAHLARRHGTLALARDAGLTGLASLLWGDFAASAANLPAVLAMLDPSRDAEREADDEAVRFLRGAGRPPEALVALLCLYAEAGRSDGLPHLPDLFRSRPGLEERLAHARQATGVEGACPAGPDDEDGAGPPGGEEGEAGEPAPDGDGEDGNVPDGDEDEEADEPPRDTTI